MKLVHLHIPRTAGSSLAAALTLHCRDNGIEFQSGHLAWDDIEHGPDTVIFTVLREPVERAISLYRYIMANPTHGKHAALSADPLGFLKGAGQFTEFNSGQTRLTAGRHTFNRALTDGDTAAAKRRLSSPSVIYCLSDNINAGLDRLSERVGRIPPLSFRMNGSEDTWISEDVYWTLTGMQEHDRALGLF